MNIASMIVVAGCLAQAPRQAQTQPDATAPRPPGALLGAQAVLDSVMKQAAAPIDDAKPPAAAADPAEEFRAAAEAFAASSDTLPAEQAANQWLALVDRMQAIPASGWQRRGSAEEEDQEPGGLALLAASLPPPPAWPAVAQAIRARPIGEGAAAWRSHCLRLLASLLMKDEAGQRASLSDLQKIVAAKSQASGSIWLFTIDTLAEAMSQISSDPSHRIAAFEFRLEQAERAESPDEMRSAAPFGFRVPDLMAMAGADKSREYMRRIVALPVMIEVEDEGPTLDLARQVALERVVDMRVPQWKLAFSMDAFDLYEAMDAKFAKPQEQTASKPDANADPAARIEAMRAMADHGFDSHDREQARSGARYHSMMALVAHGCVDDAAKIAATLTEGENRVHYHMYGRYGRDHSAVHAISQTPQAAEAADLLAGVLKANPDLPLWENYATLAALTGKTDQMLSPMRESLGRQDLKAQTKHMLQWQARNAMLAADRIDEFAALVRSQMAKSAAEPSIPIITTRGRRSAGRARP